MIKGVIYHQVQNVKIAKDKTCCHTSPSARCGDCIRLDVLSYITNCKLWRLHKMNGVVMHHQVPDVETA